VQQRPQLLLLMRSILKHRKVNETSDHSPLMVINHLGDVARLRQRAKKCSAVNATLAELHTASIALILMTAMR